MTAVAEPTPVSAEPAWDWPAWQVPAAAARAWLLLQRALVQLGWAVACEVAPEAWFARGTATAHEEAAAAYSWCPVLERCRASALAADERHGVWGGLTEAERRAVAGRRR